MITSFFGGDGGLPTAAQTFIGRVSNEVISTILEWVQRMCVCVWVGVCGICICILQSDNQLTILCTGLLIKDFENGRTFMCTRTVLQS